MADGNVGELDEWCSFAEFSTSEFNAHEINQFNFDTENSLFDKGGQGNEEKKSGEWNADFGNEFVVEPIKNKNSDNNEGANWNFANDSNLPDFGSENAIFNEHSVENEINDVTEKLFSFENLRCTRKEKEYKCLNKLYINSKLPSLLQSTGLDPVKSQDTYFHQLKIDRIVSHLCVDQRVENWISMLNKVNPRLYEDDFDYHSNVSKREKKVTTPSNHIVQNGQPIKETVLTDNSLFIDKKVESTLKKVNTHSKSVLPQLENDIKKTSEELEEKSLDEVKNIIYELQLQANIYSELLLNELDYRDKLKRDIEGQNNFISSYVAVERKINESIQNKKKKSRYGFFKQNEEDVKQPVSIPYIQRDGGPKPADLALITEILKAVERDDQGVSKLISDYVLNLGDQHNLQTVIQVRTRNGVTSLSAPEHKKKGFDSADNL